MRVSGGRRHAGRRAVGTGRVSLAAVSSRRTPLSFRQARTANGLVPHAFVGVLDSSDETTIPGVSSRTEYANGHLFFWRDGALLAQPLTRAHSSSPARRTRSRRRSTALPSPASRRSRPRLRCWSTRPERLTGWHGSTARVVRLETVGTPMEYFSAHLSPDGATVALTVRDPQFGTADVWIQDLKRNIARHFTNEKGTEKAPVWSADGRTIIYAADRHGPPHIHARDVNGGDERQVVPPMTSGAQFPAAVTPDGRSVLFSALNGDTGTDIFIAPLDASGPAVAFVHSKASDFGASPSPDGRWLAYQSDESGRSEVYVRPFRDDRSRVQVSRAGGRLIRWRADSEIFYAEGTRVMRPMWPAQRRSKPARRGWCSRRLDRSAASMSAPMASGFCWSCSIATPRPARSARSRTGPGCWDGKPGRRYRGAALVDLAALHHERHAGDGGDVGQRIAASPTMSAS